MEIRLGNWRLKIEKMDPQEDTILRIILNDDATEEQIAAAEQKARRDKSRIVLIE